MASRRGIIWMGLVLMGAACQPAKEIKTTGSIERLDPALDNVISPEAQIEIIAEGFDWSEGPLWLPQQNILIFSDVPKNTVFKWSEEKGSSVYLAPSGYTGSVPRGGEPGSNGLLLDGDGNLVLCQHGDRRLARMLAPLDSPKSVFQAIADKFDGKRLDSPNDAVFYRNDFYFTDPPYGLEKRKEDPAKEIPSQGVYRSTASGEVSVLIDSITYPNGIALSADGKYLFIANSDPEKARWYRYNFNSDSNGKVILSEGIVLFDATSLTATEKGLPDGMKVDTKGNIFATGPGGVFIFNLDGRLLGKVRLTEPSSNCALSPDEKTLYVTNNMFLLRIKMRQ